MEPEQGPSQRDDAVGVEAGTDVRAVVDWYFGDLVERVAADRAVSAEQLVAALAGVEHEARGRRDQLEDRGERIPTAGAPGTVLAVPVGTFRVLTRACDLSDEAAAAVRTVHDRMARSVARPPDGETADAVVLAAGPTDRY